MSGSLITESSLRTGAFKQIMCQTVAIERLTIKSVRKFLANWVAGVNGGPGALQNASPPH